MGGTPISNATRSAISNLFSSGSNGSSGQNNQGNGSKTGLCPDCGKIVSKLATTCPHCGRPLSSSDVEENPISKPVLQRTRADAEKIRNAQPEEKHTSSTGIFVAVVIGIIFAVWLISKLFTVEITGTIMPMP